jgi:hypothetical protein
LRRKFSENAPGPIRIWNHVAMDVRGMRMGGSVQWWAFVLAVLNVDNCCQRVN